MDWQTIVGDILGAVITVAVPIAFYYIIRAIKIFAESQWHKLSVSKQKQLSDYVGVVVAGINVMLADKTLANDIKAINAYGVSALQAYANSHRIKVDVQQLEIQLQAEFGKAVSANG